MRTGDAVNVVVFSLDGTRRRWWTSTIESVDSRCVRTFSRLGNPVGGPKGGWASQADIRAFYWFDRHYNLLESYDAAGTLSEIYVHIASPAEVVNGAMHYIDYELDVVRRAGEEPMVLDEDEFEQAVAMLGLPAKFRASCYRAVEEVTVLIRTWIPLGPSRKSGLAASCRDGKKKGAGDSES